jgi:hypothetical protein
MFKIGKLFHLTQVVDDLVRVDRAREFLASKGHHPQTESADTIVLGADQAFGMRLGFTQRTLPHDPR